MKEDGKQHGLQSKYYLHIFHFSPIVSINAGFEQHKQFFGSKNYFGVAEFKRTDWSLRYYCASKKQSMQSDWGSTTEDRL